MARMRVYPDNTVSEEFSLLGNDGYTGTLNDRQFKFLRAQGLTGTLSDMFYKWSGSVEEWDGVSVLLLETATDKLLIEGGTDSILLEGPK